MSSTIQVRVDDDLKIKSDNLFRIRNRYYNGYKNVFNTGSC